jgi:kumamolisin
MNTHKLWLAGALALGLMGAAAAAPYPRGLVKGVDVGPAADYAENGQVTVTVALELSNRAAMEQLIEAVSTPGNPQFRQFLTPEQFRAQFGPSSAAVDAVTKNFRAQGLAVTRTATAQLHVTGTAAQIEAAFGVQLHSFAVAATDTTPGYRYRAPLGEPRLPDTIAPLVRAVLGLDTRPAFAPHVRAAAQSLTPVRGASSTNTPDPPGQWTVTDYVDYYDVNPLYARGYTGNGRTLAIMTLASFTQSDAYYYWNTVLGLSVARDRITEIPIDGGSGPPSDASGSIETTIDVAQSGGIAPRASILVYEAPNTSQGFVDGLAAVVDDNKADTVSTSWGLWELFNSANAFGNGPVTDPVTGQMTTILAAQHDVFAQAALQGQSLFCSSGDYGAYDSVNALPTAPSPGQPYSFNPVLSVDSPASDSLITAAGATTLPGTQVYAISATQTVTIKIPHEQAWGWDYLGPLCVALFGAPPNCEFPIGTGGGVSIYFPRPSYQSFTPGMRNSAGGQALYELTPPPKQLIAALPAGFFGRNVPDLSTNGDPQTGYLVYYTSSVTGFGVSTYGGTSFVAPQMNGVTSLFVQGLHHRVGLLNPALYTIAATGQGGQGAPLRAVLGGDNWFYSGHPGYTQTNGVGIPDQANLFEALQQLER